MLEFVYIYIHIYFIFFSLTIQHGEAVLNFVSLVFLPQQLPYYYYFIFSIAFLNQCLFGRTIYISVLKRII